MTRDELLAKIGKPVDEGYEYGDIVFNKALRAVVELHKPEFWISLNVAYCESCQDQLYPCVTIKAVQEELQ